MTRWRGVFIVTSILAGIIALYFLLKLFEVPFISDFQIPDHLSLPVRPSVPRRVP